jgi:mRNA-degrading endonuclease RelE of RelBE toxin-antitoxin system
MRERRYSDLFKKNIKKLKGQEAKNFIQKRNEILNSEKFTHYKNLKHNLKKYKRVHVNDSYIILFFEDSNVVYFVDYEHHDKVYKHSKKKLQKYKSLKFE